MRLLDVDTYQFVVIHDPRQRTRVGESVDRYAILSHTWETQGEELSYHDWHVWLRNGPEFEEIQTRSGFKKIKDTCYMAKMMGCDRVWIDTICIDKSSSAELSEAINSMFAFYTHASVCLAFLSDVDKADGDEGFMKSRWFTRGWTLQELLAPVHVQFFDRMWNSLGTRHEIEGRELISRTTGIPASVLRNPRLLSSASIAERMSWAAKRETTRIEDTAYCLLGIFDINMPLLYGEADKAFLRLQEEILKVSTDHSIFAWSWPHEFSGTLTGKSWVTFLAPDVRCFVKTGSTYVPIDREPDEDVAGDIYSMTNLGLQIRLPLIHTCSNRSYAPLKIRRLDSSTQDVICVPVVSINGIHIRWGWPANPVVFPRYLLVRHLRYHDNVFLGRRGSPSTWLEYGDLRILKFPTPLIHSRDTLHLAFQIMFFKPGKYGLFKVAHTKGATFENNLSMLGIWHDNDIKDSSPVQEEETFRGAVFFLRQTNVEISRLVQVLLGLRQTGTGPRRTHQFHLSISRKNSPDGGDATVEEVEYLCENIQGKRPSMDLVQRLFAPRRWDREPPAAGSPAMMAAPNMLEHARHRTYNAVIGAPIDAQVQTYYIDDSVPSVRPYPVFVWEELG